MDIFRYFHPHHNPRLRGVPLRLQELGELEQAAVELKRALDRARLRLEVTPVEKVNSERLPELAAALDFVAEHLRELANYHPGDSVETIAELWEERKGLPGWETWARIVYEQLREPRIEEELELNADEVKLQNSNEDILGRSTTRENDQRDRLGQRGAQSTAAETD